MAEVTLRCEECGENITIGQSELEYESVASDERNMGAEITYEATVETFCPNGHPIELTHRFWEYPVGVENHREIEVDGATVIDDKL